MKPLTIYAVCATPRSGSGLLCEALWSTGLAGRPDEYFHPGTGEEYANEWKTIGPSDYFSKALEHGTTTNGVFGVKIMWTDFQDHVVNVPAESRSILHELIPQFRYIWIRRQDKIRQAISIWKRKQTGIISWFHDEPPQYQSAPEFNFDAVHQLVQQLYAWDQNWENYFRSRQIVPCTITYEQDLQQDYVLVVSKIFKYLELPVPEDLKIQAKRRKLSDELSEEFVRLYHSVR